MIRLECQRVWEALQHLLFSYCEKVIMWKGRGKTVLLAFFEKYSINYFFFEHIFKTYELPIKTLSFKGDTKLDTAMSPATGLFQSSHK